MFFSNSIIRIQSFLFLLALLIQSLLFVGCKDDIFNPNKDENPGGILNKQGVGASARDLLSADKYKTIVVEIQSAQGFAPTPDAINNLKLFMEKYINKPNGIIIKQSSIPAPGKSSYTANELAAIEDKNRTEYNRKDTLAIYFFFADSGYSENSNVLGIAYRNTSMVIFERIIQEYSGGIGEPERDKLETAVINHEFGHILGLVNTGTNMVEHHQDTQNGRHCTDSNCLMNWVVETGNFVENLVGSPIPDLDQKCKDDLKANGGK